MTESVLACRDSGGHVYEIDTDPNRLDLDLINDFLANSSHWARGIARETLCRAIEHSLVYGLYRDEAQIGFARLVSDHATFAYLADVFVLDGARNEGLGQWLVETILADGRLQGLRRWLLVTRDAANLYRRCGWRDLAPATYLEIWNPECYRAT
ncbi:MAG TPA: GNAT family N-acetyltransferase [Stellaceae bacterium]|jgi:GNAT superfamily N-acetyltransferase|nr:GNAT family N-acetyltransferase [Stellaceae bacterium]